MNQFNKRTDIQEASTYKFSSYEEFPKWKTKVEDNMFSCYCQQFGKGDGKHYYYCHEDGRNRCHDKAPRKTDRKNYKGSVKKEQFCLSMMRIKKDGTYKALVAKGCSQVMNKIDYDNIYSPVVDTTSLRLLFAIAAGRNWILQTLDGKTGLLREQNMIQLKADN